MERWIITQQIGILAHYLCEYSSLNVNGLHEKQRDEVKQARKHLRLAFESAVERHGWSVPSLNTMPPVTLYLLRQLGAGNLSSRFRDLPDLIAEALFQMIEQRQAPFARLQDFVHHLLHAPGDPSRVLRLGKALFGQRAFPGRIDNKRTRWQEIEDSADELARFQELVLGLRSYRGSTQERLHAIGQLVQLIGSESNESPCPAQVENILMQHAFCWPLLVVAGGLAATGLSLPLSVDVDIPDSRDLDSPAVRARRRRPTIIGGRYLDLSMKDGHGRNWNNYLTFAGMVGRDLWQSTHGHFGPFRDRVRRSVVVYDFSAADQIVEPLLRALGMARMPLSDGSAVPYLAQTVLARLLGRRWYYQSVVTGESGLRRSKASDGRRLLDYDLLQSGGIPQKLRWVFITRQFHRVIVASSGGARAIVSTFFEEQERNSRDGRAKAFAQTSEVVQAFRQSNVADAFHSEGWRKWAYIRLPEVRWDIHSAERPGLLPLEDAGVTTVLRAFRESSGPVLELSGVTPSAVASALWHINTTLIPHITRRTPPGLSWSFIRATSDEQDSSFWRNLWRLIGAPADEFERFRHAPTSEHATEEIVRALNGYLPDEQRPSHRAPDLVVLVESRRFDESYDEIKDRNPAHRPLAVTPIIDRLRLGDALKVSPVRHEHMELREALGLVRIVLLNDGATPTATPLPNLSPEDKLILRPLATFRWGFRQQMAAMVLRWSGMRGIELRRALQHLTDRGALRNVGGEYHIPAELRQQLLKGV
ncbi:MAG: hypothetical protein JWQ89_2947, partial [Devosia sp.]|uniref:hypothetical protein n=1 Tax=Devosia sp. TaxID=1871048 RepID=UPI0026388C45